MAKPLSYTDNKKLGAPVLFFIHGWPDTGALWEKQVAYFSDRFRCVCVTLPGFDPKDPSPAIDFPELLERLHATILEVKGEAPLTIVGHDWGALLTYLYDQRHPEVAARLITMDVGAHLKPASAGHALFLVSYQWYLLASYLIGKGIPFLGNGMTRAFSRLGKTPRGGDVVSRSNYPYFYFWRARLVKKYSGSLPSRYQPKKPILYLYGERKKYHFHSPKWEQIVNATPGSRVVPMKNCDHWLMLRDPQATNLAMDRFLTQ